MFCEMCVCYGYSNIISKMKRTLNNNCQALPWDDDIYFQYLHFHLQYFYIIIY